MRATPCAVAHWDDDDEFEGKEITIKACKRDAWIIIWTGPILRDLLAETRSCHPLRQDDDLLALLLMALGALAYAAVSATRLLRSAQLRSEGQRLRPERLYLPAPADSSACWGGQLAPRWPRP